VCSVVGMQQDEDSSRQAPQFSMEEVETFKDFARKPAAQQRIFDMIAPQIYGSEQIKKAIACLLFGGSRKVSSAVSTQPMCWSPSSEQCVRGGPMHHTCITHCQKLVRHVSEVTSTGGRHTSQIA
jgi:hypothetical protein